MTKLLIHLMISLTLWSYGSGAMAAGSATITLEQLTQMFADMRANTGYKPGSIDGKLLWGYFFTDQNPQKLQPAADYLAKDGYHVVNIYPTNDKKTFFLHVEKIEHHTPESLNQRNQEFYKLAEQFNLESYDGMDVGPAE